MVPRLGDRDGRQQGVKEKRKETMNAGTATGNAGFRCYFLNPPLVTA